MKKKRFLKRNRREYLLTLTHLMSPDDYEAGESVGVHKSKNSKQKNQRGW